MEKKTKAKAANAEAQVKVTLVKSLIATKPNQKETAHTLGLRRVGDSAVMKNDAVLAGKITVIRHLVKVETV